MPGHKNLLTFAFIGATLFPLMATAADAPTFTPEQEARIGKIAADYLVAHPEVLLQASQKLQQIQQQQQASAATQAVLKNAAALTQIKIRQPTARKRVKSPSLNSLIISAFTAVVWRR